MSHILPIEVQGDSNRYFTIEEEKKEIQFVEIQGVKFDRGCVTHPKNCVAMTQFHSNRKVSQDTLLVRNSQGGLPGYHCQNLQGVLIVLRKEDQSETEFCRFYDDSYVDAWALFHQHMGRKVPGS
jgi:hypothetical protein